MPANHDRPRRKSLRGAPFFALGWVLLVAVWCTRGNHEPDGTDAGLPHDGAVDRAVAADAPLGGDAAAAPTAPDVAAALDAPTGTASTPVTTAVLTFRNDNARTGAYLAEKKLDVASVRARGMALKFSDTVEGEIAGQLLYVPRLEVAGAPRDVIFAATLANNVYAFDANESAPSGQGASRKLWQVTMVDPVDPATRSVPRGIYGTPVIDPAANALYLVHSTRNIRRDAGDLTAQEVAVLNVEFFLTALDLRTGATLRTKKIEGSYPRSDGSSVAFEPRNHWCRPALLLSRGSLYLACGMRKNEQTTVFHGWIFRYDAATFTPQGVFCTTPDVTEPGDGASVWQSGSGLAEDPEGNVYFITGNGPNDFDHHNYGDALVKLSTANSTLAFAGAFTSDPEGKLRRHDVDFGSGGALVLPDAPFVFGAGKTGIAYVLARDSMAKRQEFVASVNQYNPSAPVDIFWAGGPHLHGTPAYWRGPDAGVAYLYTWGEQDYLRRHVLDLSTGMFDPARAKQGKVMGLHDTMPGGALSLSADGNRAGTGIIWATLPGPRAETGPDSRLLAQDADTLDVLWETTFRTMSQWMPPTVADGKVIVGTGGGKLFVYELGPPKP
jgi:hypothetical protein